MARDRYDVVIVGGGSAGCALANRLSADPGTSVLVLEAGHSDWKIDPFIHMPAALPFPIGSRLYDWRYETDPEPYMNGRKVFHARGKVLGGSSSINGMIFQRGNPMDYERWAAQPGMKEWDYAHCLPYFKRMETCLAGADDWRGGDGPLVLERGPAQNPLFGAFFDAVQEAGYPLTDDVNGYRQEGFARFDRASPASTATCTAAAGSRPPARTSTPCASATTSPSRRWRWPPRCGSRASARSVSTTCVVAGSAAWRPARSSFAVARSTARSCSSSQGWATKRCCATSASTSYTTRPASARTSRTTSRSTSSTPPSSRSPSPPG